MSALYFIRQAFPSDPKDTWRLASGKAFDLTPASDAMAVVPDAKLAASQAEVARLRGALEKISTNTSDAWAQGLADKALSK